ncbi:MAG: tetratricopeptide repeat protein [Egibacteraceae bacterium]
MSGREREAPPLGGDQASPRPWVLGILALLLGGLVVGGFLAAGRAPGRADPAEVDIARLERLVKAQPDAIVVRLRLAHRYFDARDHQRALAEYMAVLNRDPRNAEALSHAGWIAFEAGDVDMGERLIGSSLARQPDGPEALWFLANLRLYGRADPPEAVEPLETLLARRDLSADFRAEVERLLAEARA